MHVALPAPSVDLGRGSLGKVKKIDEMYLWRGWAFTGNDSLRSVAMNYTWPAEPEPARCFHRKVDRYGITKNVRADFQPRWCHREFERRALVTAPSPDCGCGYYGYYRLPAMGGLRHGISGIIRVWGKIQRCSFGARAQYARPELLWMTVPGPSYGYLRIRDDLARRYNCPVMIAVDQKYYVGDYDGVLSDVETYRPDLYSFAKDTTAEVDSYGPDW